MKRFGLTIAAIVTVGAFASNGYAAKVQLDAEGVDAKWQSALEKSVTDEGHSLVGAISSEKLDQIVLDGASNEVDDLSGRLETANYIIRIRTGGNGAVLDLISLAEGAFVGRAIAKNPDALAKSVGELLATANIVESQALVAHTDKGTWVETTVKGHAKKGAKGSMAAKIALMDAKRNAIDKVIGATLDIENGDQRTVQATLQGRLKYTQVDKGVDDLGPWVSIRAGVYLPDDLAKSAGAKFVNNTGMAPLTSVGKDATVNWGEGWVEAKGKAIANKGNLLARRAAWVDAQANALEALNRLAIDSKSTLGEAAAKDPVKAAKLSGAIQGAEIVSEEAKGKEYHVTIRVPLHGVRGVQAVLLDLVEPNYALNEDDFPGEDFSGVVIDMRGQQGVASMFPKILDNDGSVVFDPRQDMDPHARQERGFASYAVGEVDGFNLPDGWMYLKGSANNDSIVVAALDIGSVLDTEYGVVDSWIEAVARQPRKRPSRVNSASRSGQRSTRVRQGRNPRTVRARPKGRIPTNIVFSTKSTNKKAFYAKLKRNLRSGRVVILTDTAIGGVEGRLVTPTIVGLLK